MFDTPKCTSLGYWGFKKQKTREKASPFLLLFKYIQTEDLLWEGAILTGNSGRMGTSCDRQGGALQGPCGPSPLCVPELNTPQQATLYQTRALLSLGE